MLSNLPTVLVLEDDNFQRWIAVEMLRKCGAGQLIEASTGEVALGLLSSPQTGVDLVVCDLGLPGMDGLEFMRRLPQTGANPHLILLSAMDSSILRAAHLMAQDYGLSILGVIQKPLAVDKLAPLIARLEQLAVETVPAAFAAPSAQALSIGLQRGEFEHHFQPKVALKTGELVGVEALIRWRHPERGVLAPAEFLSQLEAGGLLRDAKFALIAASVAEVRRWTAVIPALHLSVNISQNDFHDEGLPGRLNALVKAAGLPPEHLIIEVTEESAMVEVGRTLELMTRCRMMGFGVSIDDFGTGYASMQQLTRLPLTELKIDRGFVTGASDDPLLAELVSTSVSLARRLGIPAVAEGVETQADWDLMSRLGCDSAQGYLISNPMPASAFLPWHRTWQDIGWPRLQAGARPFAADGDAA